jgi:hypothetical protein
MPDQQVFRGSTSSGGHAPALAAPRRFRGMRIGSPLIRHRLVGDKVLGYRLLSRVGYPRTRPNGEAARGGDGLLRPDPFCMAAYNVDDVRTGQQSLIDRIALQPLVVVGSSGIEPWGDELRLPTDMAPISSWYVGAGQAGAVGPARQHHVGDERVRHGATW